MVQAKFLDFYNPKEYFIFLAGMRESEKTNWISVTSKSSECRTKE